MLSGPISQDVRCYEVEGFEYFLAVLAVFLCVVRNKKDPMWMSD